MKFAYMSHAVRLNGRVNNYVPSDGLTVTIDVWYVDWIDVMVTRLTC